MLTVKVWSPEKTALGRADGINGPAGNSALCAKRQVQGTAPGS